MANICVFCGSRLGDRPEYAQAATRLGRFLANSGHRLIYGGGGTGIMGAVADAVLEKNGEITGVIPTHLARVELMHSAVQDMRVTADMHERKALMHSLSDIYVILPGGFGTMEEFFEAVTWAQLDLHSRPIAVLNLHGIYDGLIQLMDTMLNTGFMSAKCRAHVAEFQDPQALMNWLQSRTASPEA